MARLQERLRDLHRAGFYRVQQMPIAVPEELLIASHFGIKPLLPLSDPAGLRSGCWRSAPAALGLSGARVGPYRDHGLNAEGISEIWGETEYEKRTRRAPPGQSARFRRRPNAQGLARPRDLHKRSWIELCTGSSRRSNRSYKRPAGAVILAAEPKIQGNFRELARWKELLPQGILEFADAMPAEDLHRKALRCSRRGEQNRAEARTV